MAGNATGPRYAHGRASPPTPYTKDSLRFPPREMAQKSKDPVCGMMVDPAHAAARGRYGGQTVYFCSTACKATYDRQHPPSA